MDEKELEEIAERVRTARLEAGLSKEAVARKAEVSSITYKRVEDGESVRDASLAKVLGAMDIVWPQAGGIQFEYQKAGTVSGSGQHEPEFEFLTRVREDLTAEEMDQLMKEATPYLELLVRDIKSRNRGQA